MDQVQLEKVLEGMIFVAGDEGLTLAVCQSVLKLDKLTVELALNNLLEKYQPTKYGFELVKYGDIYKFVSSSDIYPYLEALLQLETTRKLSNSALETLAIIAYKQPITRLEIEEIRGVSSDMMLRKLLARGLIVETGRIDAPGRPILYGITQEFLDTFKLTDLNELPDLPTYSSDDAESDELYD